MQDIPNAAGTGQNPHLCQPIASKRVEEGTGQSARIPNQEFNVRIISVLALTAALFIAPCAHALTVDRMTSVTDHAGGTLSLSTESSSSAGSGSSQTDLVATAFSPAGAGSISGTIGRAGDRSAESITAVYNGRVTIATTNAAGNAINIVFGFEDLTVLREGEGPEYSGKVTINGHEFNASQLPDNVQLAVGRILRLFRFA